MRTPLTLFFIVLYFFTYSQKESQHFIGQKNGLFVEHFNTADQHPNRFTEDNSTYRAGNYYKYDYRYVDASNKWYKFQSMEDKDQNWGLTNYTTKDPNTIGSVEMRVHYAEDPIDSKNPNYHYTTIAYSYIEGEKSVDIEYTGLIENEMNVWVQPPTLNYFGNLLLCPYPFIQASYKIGNKWQWTKSLPSSWSDERWKKWDGNVEFTYDYRITEVSYVQSKVGRIPCYIVNAVGKSKIGETALKAYYNVDYGFVKQIYTTINGDKIIVELTEFKSAEIAGQ